MLLIEAVDVVPIAPVRVGLLMIASAQTLEVLGVLGVSHMIVGLFFYLISSND